METNSLYEKVRTAEVGRVLKYRGKVGTVEYDTGDSCDDCIYSTKRGCVAKSADFFPCLYVVHETGRTIVVRENKDGASC